MKQRHLTGAIAYLVLGVLAYPLFALASWWSGATVALDLASLPSQLFGGTNSPLLDLVLGLLSYVFLLLLLLGVFVAPLVMLAEWLAQYRGRHRFRMEGVLAIAFCLLLAILAAKPIYDNSTTSVDERIAQTVNFLKLAGIIWLILTPMVLVYWWAAKAKQLGYTLGQMLKPENAVEQFHLLYNPPEELAREH